MYTSFFGLDEKPFAITPDPRYLFLSERHAEALAHLMYGINEAGHVVGNSGTNSTPDATAWLWTPQGGRVNLINLVAPRPGLYGISSGQDINDLGQIVARAITDDPYGEAIVLTPPE